MEVVAVVAPIVVGFGVLYHVIRLAVRAAIVEARRITDEDGPGESR